MVRAAFGIFGFHGRLLDFNDTDTVLPVEPLSKARKWLDLGHFPLDGVLPGGRTMARIPETELERLKSEVSVERLAEARGVKLERRGADLSSAVTPFARTEESTSTRTPEGTR